MNAQQLDFLERFEATLKARSVARRAALEATLGDGPCEALDRHERALDLRVGDLASELGKMEGARRGERTELRAEALRLLKEAW
jgi:hypothetical protein